jgi:hypothetical protein
MRLPSRLPTTRTTLSSSSAAQRGKTRKEQLEQWNSIPAAPGTGMTTCFLLDRIGRNGFDIEATKCITAEQVECLLGEPITALIERGRKNCPDRAA